MLKVFYNNLYHFFRKYKSILKIFLDFTAKVLKDVKEIIKHLKIFVKRSLERFYEIF